MNKIEELRAALTELPNVEYAVSDTLPRNYQEFLIKAHSMMPQMLAVIGTLDEYLQRCIVDDEDRWITRELLHTQIAGLKESK